MKQGTQDTNDQNNHQVPWNKGKLIGQKSLSDALQADIRFLWKVNCYGKSNAGGRWQ